MKLIEADGKRLLAAAGIRIPEGVFVDGETVEATPVQFPAFVKAQVLQGRRGARGLVRRVERQEDLAATLAEMRGAVAGIPNAGFLIEPEVEHGAEWLVSADIDRATGLFRVTASDRGGMDVSSAEAHLVVSAAEVRALGLPSAVKDVLCRLVDGLAPSDALSIEVNPLAILPDGSCIALDAKVELDDAAAHRHPEWSDMVRMPDLGRPTTEREQAYAQAVEGIGHRGTFGRYVDLDGDIVLVLSGGGASLVALDAIHAAGGRAANYLEISGNPEPESVKKVMRVVLGKPGIRAVWIAGSFANFTDIDATVMAVLDAIDESGLHVPIAIRRDGPNADAAVVHATAWSKDKGIPLRFDRADVSLEESASNLLGMLNTV